MVVVDQIVQRPTKIRCFKAGSCHLSSDVDDLEELHEFARKIGLRREWFQEHRILPHYDLTVARRAAAIAAGAVEVDAREYAMRRRAKRKAAASPERMIEIARLERGEDSEER